LVPNRDIAAKKGFRVLINVFVCSLQKPATDPGTDQQTGTVRIGFVKSDPAPISGPLMLQ